MNFLTRTFQSTPMYVHSCLFPSIHILWYIYTYIYMCVHRIPERFQVLKYNGIRPKESWQAQYLGPNTIMSGNLDPLGTILPQLFGLWCMRSCRIDSINSQGDSYLASILILRGPYLNSQAAQIGAHNCFKVVVFISL